MTVEQFWSDFLQETGRDKNTKYFECFHFTSDEYWANELLRLVLIGKKRATTSSLWAYEKQGERIPQIGDLSIVTDWVGTPYCVIETAAVMVLPFRDMTFAVCAREGEDDCLETWKEGHARVLTQEGLAVGYVFAEDMPVVFEDFTVVYPPRYTRLP